MKNRLSLIDIYSGIKTFVRKYGLLTISALGAIASVTICLYYIFGPSEGYFHSDCADSILWANATVESNRVFDETFSYAAMLPFSSSIWVVPMIKLFGYTMGVQLWGMAIFLLLFSLSVFFMCYGYSKSAAFGFNAVSASLLILASSDKLREIMFGHVIYYSLSLLMICTGLAFWFYYENSFERKDKKHPLVSTMIFAALLVLLFGGNATNGFQLISIATLPVLGAIVAERFFDGKEKLFSRKNVPAITAAVLIVVSTVVGLLILKNLKGEKTASYATTYSTFSAMGEWYQNLSKFLEGYLSLIGVNVQKWAPLFSKESIPYLIRIVGGVVILVLPIAALVNYKKLRDSGTRMLVWVHFIVSAIIMIGYVCGRLSEANWRLTPMVGTAVFASVAYIRELVSDIKEKVCEFRLGIVLIAILILFSGVSFREIKKMPSDYGRDNYLHILAEDLEDHGLTYGYATFWRSQAITLLSDSKVKCCSVVAGSNGIARANYQVSTRWYEDQEGVDKYFVVLSKGELDTVSKTTYWKEITQKYYLEDFSSGGMFVYVFSKNIILK